MMKWQAVFIDRDGTLGGTGHFIHPKDFVLYDGSEEALQNLKNAGLKMFAFTNQHRISKGQATKPAKVRKHLKRLTKGRSKDDYRKSTAKIESKKLSIPAVMLRTIFMYF